MNFAGLGGALIAGLSGKREEELRLRQQKIDDEDRVISRKIKDLNIKREEGNLADMQAQRAAKAQALRQTLAAKGGLDMAIPSMEFDYGENDEFRAVPPQAVAQDAPLGGPSSPRLVGLPGLSNLAKLPRTSPRPSSLWPFRARHLWRSLPVPLELRVLPLPTRGRLAVAEALPWGPAPCVGAAGRETRWPGPRASAPTVRRS